MILNTNHPPRQRFQERDCRKSSGHPRALVTPAAYGPISQRRQETARHPQRLALRHDQLPAALNVGERAAGLSC